MYIEFKSRIPGSTNILILFLAGFVFLSVAMAETDKYRLSWRGDPATSVAIGWNQVDGQDPKVHYGPSDGPNSYESFVRADKRGTVFIGEGSWGAPRRPADDDKPWTMASDSFYQFKWIQVTPKHVDIRSVRFDNVDKIEPVSDIDPYALPEGLRIWKPKTGAVLRLPFDADDPTYIKHAKEPAVDQGGGRRGN